MDEYNDLFRRKIRRCVEVGFHYHDLGQFDGYYDEILSKFDTKEIVANLVRANADSCHIWAEAITDYYYPAEEAHLALGRIHKSLRGRDLIKELSEEARKHGISVLVYTSAHASYDFARLHPEWVMKDPSRNPLAPSICFNSPLHLELVKSRSSFLLTNYDIEGLFFDMMNFPFQKLACYCDTCRTLFREKYGADLPTEPSRTDIWAKFLEFRYDSNSRFALSVKEHMRAKHPGKLICFNYHGHFPFAWQAGFRPVGHSTLSDAPMAEDFAFRFSQTYPSLTSAFLAGLRPGASFQVMTDMTLGGYGDFTQRPVADLKWDLFTAKIRGGHVMVIEKILHDYSVRPAVYEMIGDAFSEVKAKEAYFERPPTKEAGLYYSLRTRDWYDQHNSDAYERCVIGAYRALVDLHYQVEFLFDESATLERLQQFPVIFLSNAAVLTEQECQMLRQYVADGGSLLATFETGLWNTEGRLKDFSIGDVLGVRYVGHDQQAAKSTFGEPDPNVEPWNFLRFAKGDTWADGVHADLDLPIFGAQAILIESVGAETLGDLKTAFPGGRPPGTAGCSPWKRIGPALAVHRFGKGKSVYFPVALDWQYASQRALPDHRNLLRNAIRYLLPNRQVAVDAPVNVESVVMEASPREYWVHFVAYWPRKNSKTYLFAAAPTVEFMEEPARYRATISLAKRIRSVRALSPETTIRFSGRSVRIDTGEVHETVIISV